MKPRRLFQVDLASFPVGLISALLSDGLSGIQSFVRIANTDSVSCTEQIFILTWLFYVLRKL